MNAAEPQELPMREALTQWCGPQLVQAVLSCERRHKATDLVGFHRARLVPDSELRQPVKQEWMSGPPNFAPLIGAWQALERDFRGRMARGDFYLVGVQTKPERTTAPQAIPGAWAADCQLDFDANAVTIDDLRFVSVSASREPHRIEADPAPGSSRQIPEVTKDNLRELTDDEVLLLLEDHARRVVENPHTLLIQPSKVSFGPIILRKMRLRAEQGELLATLAAEAQALAAWIETKISSHQTPTAGSLENSLRTAYWELKAQSKPIKA